MSLRAQSCIQHTQMVQLAIPDLIRIGFHLIHIPIDAHIPTLEEVRPGRIQPQREAARERLFILGERRQGVIDRAPIIGGDDTGVDGEDAHVEVFCVVVVHVRSCQR